MAVQRSHRGGLGEIVKRNSVRWLHGAWVGRAEHLLVPCSPPCPLITLQLRKMAQKPRGKGLNCLKLCWLLRLTVVVQIKKKWKKSFFLYCCCLANLLAGRREGIKGWGKLYLTFQKLQSQSNAVKSLRLILSYKTIVLTSQFHQDQLTWEVCTVSKRWQHHIPWDYIHHPSPLEWVCTRCACEN